MQDETYSRGHSRSSIAEGIRYDSRVNEKRWQAGDVVVLRYVETPTSAAIVHAYMGNPAVIAGVPFLANGRVLTHAARPYRVVENSNERMVLYQLAGTAWPRWLIDEGRYLPQPQ